MTHNWAGNVTFSARELHRPRSVEELASLVAGHARVKALGAGHSFSRIADTEGVLVSLSDLPPLVETDPVAATARVGAGMPLYAVCAALRERGLALPNLPSTTHLTVAGACATGTHGSGDAHATVSAGVRSVELVTAGGSTLTLSRGEPDFGGAVTSLGALGVVTALTFDVVPSFTVEQRVWEGLPWEVLFAEHARIAASAHSVSVFTDWTARPSCWVKRRTGDPAAGLEWTGAVPAGGPRHPVRGMDAGAVTVQDGVPGAWDERLPHFRVGATPSVGAEIQSEYFTRRADAPAAMRELRSLAEELAPVLRVCEIRTVAGDPCWLGPGADGRVGFHFTWSPDVPAVHRVLDLVEERLAPFAPVPHWGKVHRMTPAAVRAGHPSAGRFAALRHRLDPGGVFGNATLDAVFGGAAPGAVLPGGTA